MNYLQVEEIVPAGEIDADYIHVPGIFIDRVVLGSSFERRIAIQVNKTDKGIIYKEGPLESWLPEEKINRERIAKRAALELTEGMYVNFGVGNFFKFLSFNFLFSKESLQ